MEYMNPLLKIKRQVQTVYGIIAKSEGLTPAEAMILLRLSHNQDVSIKDVIESCEQNQGNFSSVCKRIELAGLTVRRRSKKDERVVLLNLTEEGQQIADRLEKKLDCLETLVNEEAEAASFDFKGVTEQLSDIITNAAHQYDRKYGRGELGRRPAAARIKPVLSDRQR